MWGWHSFLYVNIKVCLVYVLCIVSPPHKHLPMAYIGVFGAQDLPSFPRLTFQLSFPFLSFRSLNNSRVVRDINH